MGTTNLGALWAEVEGEGAETVLCIHGLGGTTNVWSPLLPAFANKRVVRLDLPGSARSPIEGQQLSIAGYVEAVVRLIDHLKLSSAHVVAHSMGTIVAQHLAVQHAARVSSLALFGPLAEPADAARTATHARAAVARTGNAGLQSIADAVVKGATSAETKRDRPVAVALIRESIMRQSPEGYASSCEALATAQAARVESIRVPTLLVTGDEDGVGTPAVVSALAGRITGSQVKVLSGCGHWTTFEKPFECRTALEAFYADFSRGS